VKRCNVNFPSYGSYGSYGQAVRRGTAVTTQVVQECNPSGRATQAKNCGSPLGNNWKFGSHCFTYPGTFRAMCVMMAQKKRLQGSSKDLLSTLFLHLKIPKVGCWDMLRCLEVLRRLLLCGALSITLTALMSEALLPLFQWVSKGIQEKDGTKQYPSIH
jgi:hypothetical protein